MILIKDLGMKYPRENSKNKRRYGLYRCPSCDGESAQMTTTMKANVCKECSNKSRATHGLSKSRLYNTWKSMKQRCLNSNSPSYNDYGGRNISICKDWEDDFNSFYTWASNNGYKDDLSIDRINNNKGYFPKNCRFTNQTIQSRNTRQVRINNTSGYRGVHFIKRLNKWWAYITIDYKKINLGYFDEAKKASNARNKYIRKNNLQHTPN